MRRGIPIVGLEIVPREVWVGGFNVYTTTSPRGLLGDDQTIWPPGLQAAEVETQVPAAEASS